MSPDWLAQVCKLPLPLGRDSVPWSPCPDQAPNLVSPDSRPVPFTLSLSAFPRVRFPIPNCDFSPSRDLRTNLGPGANLMLLRARGLRNVHIPATVV